MMNKQKMKDDYIRQVRAIGESLIKNAESIVGTERYLTGIDLNVTLDVEVDIPEIRVNRRFLPERFAYSYEKEGEDHEWYK